MVFKLDTENIIYPGAQFLCGDELMAWKTPSAYNDIRTKT